MKIYSWTWVENLGEEGFVMFLQKFSVKPMILKKKIWGPLVWFFLLNPSCVQLLVDLRNN